MRTQHNIMTLNSSRRLGVNSNAVSKSLERLSPGYGINHVGDDAAGLAIPERMRVQIKGLTAASDNSQDAISLVQTAEGGLQEVRSMLNRMQEPAAKSSDGTYTDDVDRRTLQDEVDALKSEINHIVDSTNFNRVKLLDGSMGIGTAGKVGNGTITATTGTTTVTSLIFRAPEGHSVQIGAGTRTSPAKWDGKTLQITSQDTAGETYTQNDLNALAKNINRVPTEVAGKVSLTADKSLTMGNAVVAGTDNILSNTVSEAATKATYTIATNGVVIMATKAGASYAQKLVVGAVAGGILETTANAGGSAKLNLKATDSYSASQTNQMLANAGVNIQASFDGEKTGAQIKVSGTGTMGEYASVGDTGLTEGGGLRLQIGDTSDSWSQLDLSVGDMHISSLGIGDTDINNQEEVSAAISKITRAINQVFTSRGKLGAIRNRLEYTINNLGVTTENITAAESCTHDADMAEEMTEFTESSVPM